MSVGHHALRRYLVLTLLALGAAVVHPAPALGYLHLTFASNGQVMPLRWAAMPVRWYATDTNVPGVTATEFQRAVEQAFDTWEAVPTASVSFDFAGFTGAAPFVDDGASVLGFDDQPDMDRVLGATTFIVDVVTGEILESDIFFNAAFDWSTAPAGAAGTIDLQSVATHEIGHFLGLGHSALGETEEVTEGRLVLGSAAVMFPISFSSGNIADRELQPDDIAGVSDLYPDGRFRAETGVARGRVRLGGRGVLGAHVLAYAQRTGALIAGFTLNEEGDFQIAGLPPGPYVIRVEPLDDADVESFFDGFIDVNFRVAYFPRVLVVPRGGAGERIDVTVRPK